MSVRVERRAGSDPGAGGPRLLYIPTRLAVVLTVLTNALIFTSQQADSPFSRSLSQYITEHQTVISFQQQPYYSDKLEEDSSSAATASSSLVAYKHSFGFFDDIPDDEWYEYFQRPTLTQQYSYVNPTSPNEKTLDADRNGNNVTAAWQYYNWAPSFSCPRLRKVGGLGDGPKWTCDPDRLGAVADERRRRRLAGKKHRQKHQLPLRNAAATFSRADAAGSEEKPSIASMTMDPDDENGADDSCLVYSIGSNGNYRFEDGLYELLGGPVCEIHIFDPGNYERDHLQHQNMHYHQWGLVGSDDAQQQQQQQNREMARPHGAREMYSFQEIRRRLGHENRTIDLFKIDCEGCEWFTFRDWIGADMRQILVETHELPVAGPDPVRFGRTVLPLMNASDFFDEFTKNGYVLFNKEANGGWGRGTCFEWSFLKLHREFFSFHEAS